MYQAHARPQGTHLHFVTEHYNSDMTEARRCGVIAVLGLYPPRREGLIVKWILLFAAAAGMGSAGAVQATGATAPGAAPDFGQVLNAERTHLRADHQSSPLPARLQARIRSHCAVTQGPEYHRCVYEILTQDTHSG